MPPAAVVFDLDGTLVDSMTIVPTVSVDTIRALGGPEVTPERVVVDWHTTSVTPPSTSRAPPRPGCCPSTPAGARPPPRQRPARWSLIGRLTSSTG